MLILDEPTNHLDIFLREQLEDILITLPIPMIIVSHDEYFVEKMKCTQVLDLYHIENKKEDLLNGGLRGLKSHQRSAHGRLDDAGKEDVLSHPR
jgi:ATPase subunit of ABC transporter with duplicated ATPase domains